MKQNNAGTSNIYYICKDHLGSITALLNTNGTVAEEYSYDAWGQRRNPDDWSSNYTAPTLLNRGYTGHEHLDQFGLINMNGRMYDPYIGRMLSPDDYVQSPCFTQSYNRYTYCNNNPLKYIDPSGESRVHVFHGRRMIRRAGGSSMQTMVGFFMEANDYNDGTGGGSAAANSSCPDNGGGSSAGSSSNSSSSSTSSMSGSAWDSYLAQMIEEHTKVLESKGKPKQPDGVYIDKSSNYKVIPNGAGRSNALQFKTNVYYIKNGIRTELYENIYMYANESNYTDPPNEQGKYYLNRLPLKQYKLEYTPVYRIRPPHAQYGNGFTIDKSPGVGKYIQLHPGERVDSYAGCWGISQYTPRLFPCPWGSDYLGFNYTDMQSIINKIHDVSVTNNIPVFLRPNE